MNIYQKNVGSSKVIAFTEANATTASFLKLSIALVYSDIEVDNAFIQHC